MKTAEQQFYEDWPNSPAGREWDKFEKQAKYFDSGSMIDFAERFSDQQNKELREEREQLAEQYRKDGEQINDMILQHEEDSEVIIALKKEVEELNWVKDEIDTAREWMKVHEGENSRYLQIQEELTRLRELLGKCRDSLSGTVVNLGFDSPMDHQIAEQLIDEIDNALNHKP